MTDDNEVRGIHLFADDILIANLTTGKASPEPTYVIDGLSYETVGYVSVIEASGRRAFDVQVKPSEQT